MTQFARIALVAITGLVLTVVLEVRSEHPLEDHLQSSWPFLACLVGFFWANFSFMAGSRPTRLLLALLSSAALSCVWQLVTMLLVINFLPLWHP